MTGRASSQLWATICIAALVAFVAASVAAPNGDDAKTVYYVAGHVFGVGEQQVYVIARTATLTVRFRDASGAVQSRTFSHVDRSSVAWTIEGMSSAGGPVLAVNTAGAKTPNRAASAGPQPSPILDAHGAGVSGGSLAELSGADFLLGSLTSDLPDIGRLWFSKGGLPVKYGTLTLLMNNIVSQPTGDQAGIIAISSTGGCDYRAKMPVSGFGIASLRGGGGATAQSYLESQDRLLLGMSVVARSRGNAKVGDRTGTYTLEATETIKLLHYTPGVPDYSGAAGFVRASTYPNTSSTSDTSIYSTDRPQPVLSPAATNTEFIPAQMAPVTPYPSALPEVSLPPIPIPQSSDQPVASPPPPPTPAAAPSVYP